MTFEAGAIRATAELDKSPFIRSITELRAEARKGLNVKVGADTAEGDAKVLAFKRSLAGIGNGTTTARVSADTTAANLRLKPLQDRLAAIRNQVSTARIRLDGDAAAKAKLDDLDISLKAIGQRVARPRVSLAGAESAEIALDRLELRLARVGAMSASAGGGGRGGVFSRIGALGSHAPGALPLAVGAALPLAAPLAGVAAGGLASFLTPTLAGGIGGGLFAKVAQSQYKVLQTDVKNLTTLQQRYTAATTNKARTAALAAEKKAWDALSPAEQKAVNTQHKLTSEWDKFRTKLQPQTFRLFSTGADIADKGLKLLLPTVKAAGNTIDGLASSADKALNQPFWHHFFGDFLPGEAHRALSTLGTDLGHGVTGIAHLMERLAPLGHDLEHATAGWAGKFESWTKSDGPGKFVNWVQKNGPVVADDIKGIASGVSGIAKGLAPIGGIELKAFAGVGKVIGDLADDHPKVITAIGAALLSVSVGLKAIAAVKGVSEIIGTIGGLKGGKVPTVGGASGSLGGGCCCGPGGGGGTPTGAPGEKAPTARSPLGFGKTLIAGTLAGSFPDAPTGRPLPGGASDAVKMAKQFYAAGGTAAAAVAVATAGYPSQTKALQQWEAQVNSAAKAQRDGLNKAMTEAQTTAGGAKAKVDAYRQSLIDQGVPLQAVITKTATFAATLRAVPAGVHTKITADTSQAHRNLQVLRQEIVNLPNHTVRITTTTRGGATTTHGLQMATGGTVGGHGGPRADDQVILASTGEEIINARAASMYRPLLKAINAKGFADGGTVPLPKWLQGTPSPNAPTSGSGSSGSAGSSKSKGPSKAATANVLAGIANFAGLTFASDLQGTAHQIRSGITQMIDRLNEAVRNHYLAGDAALVKALKSARAPLANLAAEEEQVNKALSTAQQRLATLKGSASSVRSGTVGSFLGLGDLTQASSTTTVGGLLSVEGQQVKVARAFDRNLATLRKRGLSRSEYLALEQAGPAAAGQIVGLLATSTRGQITKFNRDEAILHTLGLSTGKASADYVYGARITAAAGDVAELRADRKALRRDSRRTADAIEKLVKDGLSDHGTHDALAAVEAAIHRSNQLLAHLAGAPHQAHTNGRAHVAGVNRRGQ